MKDYATAEGTARFCKRMIEQGVPKTAFRPLGLSGWITSALGFGSYRISREEPEHRNALEKALLDGCNLIDTSSNYAGGESEACIGEVLSCLFKKEKLRRDEVVVVSKVGYIQGSELEQVKELDKAAKSYANIVKYSDDCWHCISPGFINEQLTRSLERLGLSRLDCYLLHNPEHFLAFKKKAPDALVAKFRMEFYRRIHEAFSALEEQVTQGRISCYGISSNTLASPIDSPEAISLTKLCAIARDVARERTGNPNEHHFAVIELPINLFEGQAVLEQNNGEQDNQTVLEFAQEKNIIVLSNRPLNTVLPPGQLLRLIDFAQTASEEPLDGLLAQVAKLEHAFVSEIAPHIDTAGQDIKASQFFRWSAELNQSALQNLRFEQWKQLESEIIVPQLHCLIDELDRQLQGELAVKWKSWKNLYLTEIEKFFGSIRRGCERHSSEENRSIAKLVDRFLPHELKHESLSRKALAILINTRGISCILNGMRIPDYVDDSLGAMYLPLFNLDLKIYRTFKR
ncbi:MAG: aldo/keto reductase [Deltaproteobacteria bacterium]|nr:aldo/keto reductase [Deltaproteobacteria bacterium]